MWIYEDVTRQEFETIKDKIEKFNIMPGGNKVIIEPNKRREIYVIKTC